MTDPQPLSQGHGAQRVARRNRAERRFRLYGMSAVALALLFLGAMFATIIYHGHTAFYQTAVRLDVALDAATLGLGPAPTDKQLGQADYQAAIRKTLRAMFPGATDRRAKRALYTLISNGAAYDLRDRVLADPALIGATVSLLVPASADVDMVIKGTIPTDVPESQRRIKDNQLAWIGELRKQGRITSGFNSRFFTHADSREPELAGILGAVMGSFFALAVCLALSFPLGVLAAVYLEEFAPKNLITDLIEININNLAAVPSIVFGLLGLAVFLGIFSMTRSAPLVGGMVLALMTLPTIIIAARAALKAVPPSIRQAALGVGASPMQATFHHVVPLAMPGILTGTIIGMAQALGETAPLLMIGMVAFIVDVPGGITDPATALPVQVYLWADSAERGFVEKTSAAIITLLVFLVCMNLFAVYLRSRFERRW